MFSPDDVMMDARLQEADMLTAQPPAVSRSCAVSMRLYIGKAHPLCKEKDCGQQYKRLTTALLQQGQQVDGPDCSRLMECVSAHHTCSATEAGG